MSGVATVQRHIDDKARIVLDAYLRSRLASASITGVTDRLDALRIAIGLDPAQMPDTQIDTLPRVDVYAVDARSEYDLTGTSLDVVFSYDVSAITQVDVGDVASAARPAAYLAGEAAECLEQYMRDAGSTACVYRIDVVSPVSVAPGPFDGIGERTHTMQAIAQVEIRARATFSNLTTYASPTLGPGYDPVFVQDADADVLIDAGSVGSATTNRAETITVAGATVAGGTTATLDVSGVTTWGGTPTWSVYLQAHNATVTGSGTSPAVTLATYSISDGDRWLVVVLDGDTGQPRTWALTWDLT